MRPSWIAPLLALVPIVACADWQYTHWGMSVDEVIAGSNGAVQKYEPSKPFPRPPQIKAKGQYSASGFSYEVTFYFDDDGKLAWVVLGQKEPGACGQIREALMGKYGAPAESSPPNRKTVLWRDEKSQTVIEWRDNSELNRLTGGNIENDCFIMYKSLDQVGEGL